MLENVYIMQFVYTELSTYFQIQDRQLHVVVISQGCHLLIEKIESKMVASLKLTWISKYLVFLRLQILSDSQISLYYELQLPVYV